MVFKSTNRKLVEAFTSLWKWETRLAIGCRHDPSQSPSSQRMLEIHSSSDGGERSRMSSIGPFLFLRPLLGAKQWWWQLQKTFAHFLSLHQRSWPADLVRVVWERILLGVGGDQRWTLCGSLEPVCLWLCWQNQSYSVWLGLQSWSPEPGGAVQGSPFCLVYEMLSP